MVRKSLKDTLVEREWVVIIFGSVIKVAREVRINAVISRLGNLEFILFQGLL